MLINHETPKREYSAQKYQGQNQAKTRRFGEGQNKQYKTQQHVEVRPEHPVQIWVDRRTEEVVLDCPQERNEYYKVRGSKEMKESTDEDSAAATYKTGQLG